MLRINLISRSIENKYYRKDKDCERNIADTDYFMMEKKERHSKNTMRQIPVYLLLKDGMTKVLQLQGLKSGIVAPQIAQKLARNFLCLHITPQNRQPELHS